SRHSSSVIRHFLNGLVAIPLHRPGHWRLQRIQLLRRTPADVVMLPGGALHGRGILRPRPINHADVLMRAGNAMNIQKPGRNQRARSRTGSGRALAEQNNIQTAFFLRLAQGSLFRVFIQLDMAAERQPGVQLAMMDEQDLRLVNDEDSDREINFFVDVRHADLRFWIYDWRFAKSFESRAVNPLPL